MDEIFLRIKETFFENRENDTEFHNLNLPASKLRYPRQYN